MPVALNASSDALLIVLDERKNGRLSFFTEELKRVFEKKKYVYYQNSELDARALYCDVNQMIEEQKVVFPSSQRILFCHYLDLNDVDDDWVTRYRERAAYFKNMSGVTDADKHYHFIFLRYQVIYPLGEDRQEKIFRNLNELWRPGEQATLQSLFLLHAAGFGQNLDSQEKGMVRLMRLLTSRDYRHVFEPHDYRNGLFILNENEYYENAAQICANKLEDVREWLTVKKDDDLNNFFLNMGDKIAEQMRKYQKEARQFKQMAGMYPISIQEYTRSGWGPWAHFVRPAGVHPQLKKEEQAWRTDFMESLVSCPERQSWESRVLTALNYQDLEELYEETKAGRSDQRIQQIVKTNAEGLGLDYEIQKYFVEAFQLWLKEFMEKENITDQGLRERKEKAADEQTYWESQRDRRANYPNLQACFENIDNDTVYQIPVKIPPEDRGKIAFVNHEVADAWEMQGYQVSGMFQDQVVVLGDIEPNEIVFLKLGIYLPLDARNPENSVRELMKVIS